MNLSFVHTYDSSGHSSGGGRCMVWVRYNKNSKIVWINLVTNIVIVVDYWSEMEGVFYSGHSTY